MKKITILQILTLVVFTTSYQIIAMQPQDRADRTLSSVASYATNLQDRINATNALSLYGSTDLEVTKTKMKDLRELFPCIHDPLIQLREEKVLLTRKQIETKRVIIAETSRLLKSLHNNRTWHIAYQYEQALKQLND